MKKLLYKNYLLIIITSLKVPNFISSDKCNKIKGFVYIIKISFLKSIATIVTLKSFMLKNVK